MRRGFFGHKGWGKKRHGHGHANGHGHEAVQEVCAACPVVPSLNDTAPGQTCRIRRLCGCGPVRQRLLDLGLQPCREVTVIRSAPLRDPIELRVGDSFIVLRRREAAQVEIDNV
ncbi:ferrous iron transport protein A [Rhodovulum iodosum]|uniref:Ferrous iron transport protein A n=1 Tax=Rhodovulum iodosum TaxID=68291 RepID=A0ABV3XN55_9RHOB|nr:FeoA family protein [Rhodovulum robiginosum]RSK35886.1 ferrous iron transport protein A [Rhodovulum robiginosum]